MGQPVFPEKVLLLSHSNVANHPMVVKLVLLINRDNTSVAWQHGFNRFLENPQRNWTMEK